MHPEISAPSGARSAGIPTCPERLRFFDSNFNRGPDFDDSLFHVGSEYVLDATPNYLAKREAMARLVSLIAHPKFIVSMRDPVARIVSEWNHCPRSPEAEECPTQCGEETFVKNVEKELAGGADHKPGGGLFGAGCYGTHIEHGIQLVGKAPFHFTFYEKLSESFEREFCRIFEFLGVGVMSPGRIYFHQNSGSFRIGRDLQMWLRELYREESQKLEEVLGEGLPWSWHRKTKGTGGIGNRQMVEGEGTGLSGENPLVPELLQIWSDNECSTPAAAVLQSSVFSIVGVGELHDLRRYVDSIGSKSRAADLLCLIVAEDFSNSVSAKRARAVESVLIDPRFGLSWFKWEGKRTVWFCKVGPRQRFGGTEGGTVVSLDREQAKAQVSLWAHRILGRKPRRLPSLLVAGFPKCGTTSLFGMLSQHPRFDTARRGRAILKELNFFTRHYDEGREWYESHYAPTGRLFIDATPNYISDRRCLERIRNMIPDAKFVLMMRDPVSRAYSAWNYWNYLGFVPDWEMPFPREGFERNFWPDVKGGRERRGYWGMYSCGLYAEQIRNLLDVFGRESVLFCFTEDLRRDPQEEMDRIFDFMGVHRVEIRVMEMNTSPYVVAPIARATESALTELYRESVGLLRSEFNLDPPWARWD